MIQARASAARHAHAQYRAAGYRTLNIRLERIVDDRGQARKRPHFFGGTWKTAEATDVAAAVRAGFLDVALVCEGIAGLDFDPRPGESYADLRARCQRARREYGLRGAMVERTGNGLHLIMRAPAGEWKRRIWGDPHPIDEVRSGCDSAGNGLLLFVAPSWHPVAERWYERAGPIIPVTDLPECPRELLEQPVRAPSPTRPVFAFSNCAEHAGWVDFRTLDVVRLFVDQGLYRSEIGKQKHGVRCPWESSHTSGSDGTDTAIFEAAGGYGPLFRCLHAHCADRTMRDVRAYFGRDTVAHYCTAAMQKAPDQWVDRALRRLAGTT